MSVLGGVVLSCNVDAALKSAMKLCTASRQRMSTTQTARLFWFWIFMSNRKRGLRLYGVRTELMLSACRPCYVLLVSLTQPIRDVASISCPTAAASAASRQVIDVIVLFASKDAGRYEIWRREIAVNGWLGSLYGRTQSPATLTDVDRDRVGLGGRLKALPVARRVYRAFACTGFM